jgi:hypothetical protein
MTQSATLAVASLQAGLWFTGLRIFSAASLSNPLLFSFLTSYAMSKFPVEG